MSGDWPWSSLSNLEAFGLFAVVVVGILAVVAIAWWLGTDLARKDDD